MTSDESLQFLEHLRRNDHLAKSAVANGHLAEQGAALRPQLVEQLPCGLAEQTNRDLAIGERGVVVGNLAQPRRGAWRRRQRFGG